MWVALCGCECEFGALCVRARMCVYSTTHCVTQHLPSFWRLSRAQLPVWDVHGHSHT